jgi:hypothetical protein
MTWSFWSGSTVRQTVSGQTLTGALAKGGQITVAGQANDRQRPIIVANEAGQRREDLFERQVASRAEEHESVRGNRPRRAGSAKPGHLWLTHNTNPALAALPLGHGRPSRFPTSSGNPLRARYAS